LGNSGLFDIHITPVQRLLWLGVAAYLGRVRFHWHTMGYYF
ncbi:MAG: hypothetical protein ACI88H_000494, partial [Cocleimonas sp.]